MRRLLILILALGWGTLVFSIMRYWHYSTDADSLAISGILLRMAVFAALPLFIGAFIANAKTGWHGLLRGVCVVWLAGQAMLLLGLTGFNPVVFPPFIGAYLLLPRQPLSRQQGLNRAILGLIVFGLAVFYQSTKYICYPERRIIPDKEYLERFVDRMLKSGNVKLHGWDNTVEAYLATHPTCCHVSSNAFWNRIDFSADVVVSMRYEMSEEEKARGGYKNTYYEYLAFLDSCGRQLRSTGESFTPNPTMNVSH